MYVHVHTQDCIIEYMACIYVHVDTIYIIYMYMYLYTPVHVKGMLLRCVHVLVMFHREPEGLKLLVKLYVERSYSVWKEPEVCVVYTVVGTLLHVTNNTTLYIFRC